MCEQCEMLLASLPTGSLQPFEDFRPEFEALAAKAGVRLEETGFLQINREMLTPEAVAKGIDKKVVMMYGLACMAGYLVNSIVHDGETVIQADEMYRSLAAIGWAVGHVAEQSKQ